MDAPGLRELRVALGVDALAPQPGGIGRYTWELCKGLSQRKEIQSLRYFGHRRLIEEPRLLLEGKKLPRRRRIFRPFRAWQLRRTLRTSLVHGPNYFLPPSVEGGIITVHDLSVFRFPETHPAARIRAFERMFQSSVARAAHIITDTETVRNELIEMFGVDPTSVTAVHLGVDDRFRPSGREDLSPSLRSLGLNAGEYALCVSTLEPRKKIPELLSAWRRLPRNLRSRFPLVLAGGAGWENHAIRKQINQAAEEGWLRHLGFVQEETLPALFAGASLFVYPSAYEGFGLPPVEAMASGVPVIVANRSCLPEVCGLAARYVDPDNDDEFANVIGDSLEDRGWRERAIAVGLDQSARFSWRRCVDETLSVYRKVINLG